MTIISYLIRGFMVSVAVLYTNSIDEIWWIISILLSFHSGSILFALSLYG